MGFWRGQGVLGSRRRRSRRRRLDDVLLHLRWVLRLLLAKRRPRRGHRAAPDGAAAEGGGRALAEEAPEVKELAQKALLEALNAVAGALSTTFAATVRNAAALPLFSAIFSRFSDHFNRCFGVFGGVQGLAA